MPTRRDAHVCRTESCTHLGSLDSCAPHRTAAHVHMTQSHALTLNTACWEVYATLLIAAMSILALSILLFRFIVR